MRGLVWLLLFLVSLNFVFAVEDWNDIEVADGEPVVDETVDEEVDLENESFEASTVLEENFGDEGIESDSFEYTWEYYVAWSFAVFGFLIVVYLIYSLIRGPKNRWENKLK